MLLKYQEDVGAMRSGGAGAMRSGGAGAMRSGGAGTMLEESVRVILSGAREP